MPCGSRSPDGLLKVGDLVRVEIDGIGALTNSVVKEPDGFLAPELETQFAWTR